MTAIIHVGGRPLVDVLTSRGWVQGDYETGDGVCLHGAIRRCQPVPGDAAIIETVESKLHRWSTGWNDDDNRTETEVLDLAARGWDITDTDLADTFGPQWRAVIALVRRTAALTPDEARSLAAAWSATRVAARDAARDAALYAARDAVRTAALDAAARDAARDAGRAASRNAALDAAAWDGVWDAYAAAWDGVWDAAIAVVTWDLVTDRGPYTIAHRDLLIGPWQQVIGEPTDLVDAP